jgi:hypothetical protein
MTFKELYYLISFDIQLKCSHQKCSQLLLEPPYNDYSLVVIIEFDKFVLVMMLSYFPQLLSVLPNFLSRLLGTLNLFQVPVIGELLRL